MRTFQPTSPKGRTSAAREPVQNANPHTSPHSLSVLLPVHNAQATLSRLVADTLEVLPELTPRFELLIVDDGSDDATSEVAHELANQYPQVEAIRHAQQLGREEVIRSGLASSDGEYVLLLDEANDCALNDIAKLWRQMDHNHMVFAHRALTRPGVLWRLLNWFKAGATTVVGYGRPASDSDAPEQPQRVMEMVRRRAVRELDWPALTRDEFLSRLDSAGYDWDQVELSEVAVRHDAARPAARFGGHDRRIDTGDKSRLMQRAREFARGE